MKFLLYTFFFWLQALSNYDRGAQNSLGIGKAIQPKNTSKLIAWVVETCTCLRASPIHWLNFQHYYHCKGTLCGIFGYNAVMAQCTQTA